MELAHMPVELQNQIFVQLRNDGPWNLLPAALVSRHFYAIVTPLIYESIRIDITGSKWVHNPMEEGLKCIKPPVDTFITRLSAGTSTRGLVRNVHVFGRGEVHPEILELLLSWLPGFRQLNSFFWDVTYFFPTTLFNNLAQRWPNTHLHMCTSMWKGNLRKEWKVLRLAPSMLRTLQVCMPNHVSPSGQKQARYAKEKLLQVLENCPGLQSLTTYGLKGHIDTIDRFRLGPSGPSGPSGLWHDAKLQHPLPQLLELSIADRTFEVEDLLTWGANEGWAKLRKITLWDHRLLHGFRGCEKSLQSINLINANEGYEETLAKICSRTILLTELKIRTGILRLPLSTLKTFGHSLKAFAIHPHVDAGGCWKHVTDVPLEFLGAVQRHFPELTTLAMSLCQPCDSSASFESYRSFEHTLTLTKSKDHLSALSRIPRLTELTMHVSRSTPCKEDNSTLAAVEHTFRQITELGGTEQSLKSLTLQDGALLSDWDNPWGVSSGSSRVFQATKSRDGGERAKDLKFEAWQKQGPLENHEAFKRRDEQEEGEKEIGESVPSIPPEILRKAVEMFEMLSGQRHRTSSGNEGSGYEIPIGDWTSKLAEYEERWNESSGILPTLDGQLHEREEQAWKLWDMPLMKADDGSEGFLYDRMVESPAEP